MIICSPTCGLCGDETENLYECRTCRVQACGCCVGVCQGCGDLVCAECGDPGPPLDPGCPRCVRQAMLGKIANEPPCLTAVSAAR